MDDDSKQALVELLFLSLYQDGHLSIEEDGALEKALKGLGWEPEERSGPSVGKAFAAVREANSDELKKEAFLKERAVMLKDQGHSSMALEWLGKVLGSDGIAASEDRFLERARRLLFD